MRNDIGPSVAEWELKKGKHQGEAENGIWNLVLYSIKTWKFMEEADVHGPLFWEDVGLHACGNNNLIN